jgi:hypothetical protein
MFMPHFGQGGRTSKLVIASLLARRECLLAAAGEASSINLEIVFDHCHPNIWARDESLMNDII